ncbi:MAG: hypothetical protein ABSD57_05495 [Verrucomicrobiota bacterium]|jgi:hypothetical protein
MTIFGDGTQTRAFSHIDDVAPVIAVSIARPACNNQIFNVGAEKAYSVAELAQVVARAMGVKPATKHFDTRNEVVHAYSAHEKVRKYFGDLIKNISLGEGIARMAAWAKKNRSAARQAVCRGRSAKEHAAFMGGAVADLKARRSLRVHPGRAEFEEASHLGPATRFPPQEAQHPEIRPFVKGCDHFSLAQYVAAQPPAIADCKCF